MTDKIPPVISPQGVVFDWGGVIIDEPSRDLQCYCSQKMNLSDAAGGAAIWRHLPAYQNSHISERQFWERVCTDCNQDFQVIPAHSLWAEALRAVFRFRPKVLSAMAHLRQQGCRIGFLSNTEPEAAAYFHEIKMDKLFDASVLSCEVGILKPHPDIYGLLSTRIGLPPEKLLFLDDRSENVDGARRAGMQSVCVSTVDEILNVLTPLMNTIR